MTGEYARQSAVAPAGFKAWTPGGGAYAPPTMQQGGKIYLGHIGKVPVYAGFEAIFLLVYIFSMGSNLPGEYLITLFLVFLLTILLHELGHAVVALAQGMMGVSITLSALGGYCSYSGERHPYREFLISLTGPVTNLFIAWMCWLLKTNTSIDDVLLRFFVEQMFYWNLVLGILNLIPIYPLDGGQVVLSLCRLFSKNDPFSRRFTLGLSVVAAVVALGALIALNPNHFPILTLVLVMILLSSAFRDLR
jgi:Zn-dependent protease